MPTVYHRDQPGAPVPTYFTSQNHNAQFQAFKVVVKGCLVSGYTGKPAAGWELIAEGTNYLVLRNGSHTGFVCFTWVTGGVVRIYLAETYTGMSGDVMTGDGLKSGLSVDNANPHMFPLGFFAFSDALTGWVIIADERTFILASASTNNAPGSLDNGLANANVRTIYIGEDSAGTFVACGGDLTGSTSSYVPGFGDCGFTTLKNPQTGLLVGSGSIAVYTPGLPDLSFNPVAPNVPIAEVSLSRAPWLLAAFHAGYLRGIALCPQLVFYTYARIVGRAMGLTFDLSCRTLNTPIPLGDAYSYFVRVTNWQQAFFFLTDNPDFW
ncbi:hypothetical protein EA796_06885 [Pseudomonas sp. AOB-7]|uniref:hypothetical protein n=1 Tax=Pseudomonas sp. AOB-7 TaxID=2482750 RepID=UPI000EFC08CE|nr:hypothetical protein [Pseudomonas sp. AOB-7]RMH85228.1 hypothetical protein EA796_06885 [Pseudomonas sp. AOB-7]